MRERLDVVERDLARRRDDLVADRAARRATCGTGAAVACGTRRPACHTPVSAVSISGEPWTAVRCMWCSTARMPPSSSPPPARPGPPCTRCGTGEPCPVDERASSRSRSSTRPLNAAMRESSSTATPGSCVATLVTSEPPPRATRSAASSTRARSRARRRPGRTPRPRARRRPRHPRIRSSSGVDERAVGGCADRAVGARHLRARPSSRAAASPPAASSSRDLPQHLVALLERGERAHRDALGARVADDDALVDRARTAATTASTDAVGHDRPPDRRALLPGLRGHLDHELLDEGVELGRSRRRRRGRAPRR